MRAPTAISVHKPGAPTAISVHEPGASIAISVQVFNRRPPPAIASLSRTAVGAQVFPHLAVRWMFTPELVQREGGDVECGGRGGSSALVAFAVDEIEE
nr:hypothetical protein Itr_chr08CG18170 [Ipomoea trifida]